MKSLLPILLAALLPAPALAAPAASLRDLAWLEGTWQGEGIAGAPALEAYSPAAGGQLLGHFRQLKADGSVMFYELLTIVEERGTLVYRLRHFNADLTAWEEKDKSVAFPLTAASANRFDFSGLVYERTGADSMSVTVQVEENGKTEALTFRFRRTGTTALPRRKPGRAPRPARAR